MSKAKNKTTQTEVAPADFLGSVEPERKREEAFELDRLFQKVTGWKPRMSWEDGIADTIRWYAENRDAWIGRVDWR